MKRGGELKRTKPLEAKTPLKRTTAWPAPATARSYLHANSAAHRQRIKAQPRTGPTVKARALVAARSGGMCEWLDCYRPATDVHHRLNRKAGGRGGAMSVRINQPGWLLHACRPHHAAVTSPSGAALDAARDSGWLLREGVDALTVPVLSRHGRVWLSNDGCVLTTNPTAEEATA